jgi:hypothetical protein
LAQVVGVVQIRVKRAYFAALLFEEVLLKDDGREGHQCHYSYYPGVLGHGAAKENQPDPKKATD